MKSMTKMNENSIPKIIHYCWFGPNKMENIHKKCLDSWRKHLPEFQIMKWDDSNTKISDHAFLEAAYNLKKWAFVSDYVRLQKLYEFGGIYLDTDMLLLKPLDRFLLLETFFGAENSNYISCGIIGARKGDDFIGSSLRNYNDISLTSNTLPDITIPQLITSHFRSKFQYEGGFSETVKVPGVTVFPPLYFYSLPYKERFARNKKKYVEDKSYAVHLWDESWKEQSAYENLKKGKYQKGWNMFSKRGAKNYSYRSLLRGLIGLIKSLIKN